MSLKVAVVYEDHTNDQYIVEPVLSSLFTFLGKPRARLQSVTNPRLQGLASLLEQLCSVIGRYAAAGDMVIVVVDGDCQDGRHQQLVRRVTNCPDGSDKAVVVVAVQEVEVWALWAQRNRLGVDWNTVRSECHPKERFFSRLLTEDDSRVAGGGRLRLINASLERGWSSIKAGCPELEMLENEVRALL
jgi:hypothetical protein